MGALKDSLVRDLDWLLNTRRIVEPAPDLVAHQSVWMKAIGDLPDDPLDDVDDDEGNALAIDGARYTTALIPARDPNRSMIRLVVTAKCTQTRWR